MNINQLPENHHVISSMVNPFDPNEELFFVTHPRVNTYLDLDVWFCDMGTGDMRVVEPYGKVSDVRLLDYMEKHVSNNSVQFLYPRVILESANASKALHRPSPEEISSGASREYEARKAALKELLESGSEIKPIPKTVYYTKEFSDALEDVATEQREVSDQRSSEIPTEPSTTVTDLGDGFSRIEKTIGGRTLVSYDEKAHIPFPRKRKSKKPNHNLNAIMGLLARAKK